VAAASCRWSWTRPAASSSWGKRQATPLLLMFTFRCFSPPAPIKRPTWFDTQGCYTTSAYSLTGLPDQPGCPSSSRPTRRADWYYPRAPLITRL
jgi:hypothetical protein